MRQASEAPRDEMERPDLTAERETKTWGPARDETGQPPDRTAGREGSGPTPWPGRVSVLCFRPFALSFVVFPDM